ncbi:DUF6602 domain-containing protein [Bdellovibrio bacteriovorus]|uniref:DUF6602 domain-containing protein n=1 Tax=Bdellovibrio bacteriovorus TaxID=959 RepID=UPI003AA7E7C3
MASNETVSLKQILEDAAKTTRASFDEIRKNNPHYGDAGSEVEDILKTFLKERMPRRFDAEGGYVVGADEKISLQTDVIIFDALNCPIYRRTKQACIVPRDNVAAVIEVKSKLNKEELKDAAKKIAAAKKINPTPINGFDQPVNFANLVNTSILGCVFAYESATTLETLAENLKEISAEIDSNHWIDMVVVLDKGIISYVIQYPMGKEFPGWFGGALSDGVVVPPVYVHLVTEETASLSLNHFYVRLMSHLSIYRQRSSVPFDAALGKEQRQTKTIEGYQYNLKNQLVPAEEKHRQGSFQNPKVRYNLYDAKTGNFIGQSCLWPWQEGATVTFAGHINPQQFYGQLFRNLKCKISYFLDIGGKNGMLMASNVVELSEADFKEAIGKLPPAIVSKLDEANGEKIPMKIDPVK